MIPATPAAVWEIIKRAGKPAGGAGDQLNLDLYSEVYGNQLMPKQKLFLWEMWTRLRDLMVVMLSDVRDKETSRRQEKTLKIVEDVTKTCLAFLELFWFPLRFW